LRCHFLRAQLKGWFWLCFHNISIIRQYVLFILIFNSVPAQRSSRNITRQSLCRCNRKLLFSWPPPERAPLFPIPSEDVIWISHLTHGKSPRQYQLYLFSFGRFLSWLFSGFPSFSSASHSLVQTLWCAEQVGVTCVLYIYLAGNTLSKNKKCIYTHIHFFNFGLLNVKWSVLCVIRFVKPGPEFVYWKQKFASARNYDNTETKRLSHER